MSHKYMYTKEHYFQHRLKCYAGAENKRIPDGVFTKIQENMVGRHITLQQLTKDSLHSILKETKLTMYYENIPTIFNKLTSNEPMDLQNYQLSPSQRLYPANLVVKSISLPTDTQCCICLDDILGDIDAVQTECTHYFHTQCIHTWQKQQNSCPYCRRELNIIIVVENERKTSGLVNIEAEIMAKFKEWRQEWVRHNPKKNMPRFDYLIKQFWQEIINEHLDSVRRVKHLSIGDSINIISTHQNT